MGAGDSESVASLKPNVSSSNICQDGYSRQLVESGQKENVFLSWFESPEAFWVQKDGCEDTLTALLSSAEKVMSEGEFHVICSQC